MPHAITFMVRSSRNENLFAYAVPVIKTRRPFTD